MQLTPTLRDILQAGVLAPSADNHHRLRFEPTEKGVRVWSEPGRLAGLVGYKRTLDLVSAGTVIENIVLQASAHYLASSIGLFSEKESDLVADIMFFSTRNEPDSLHTAIPRRHTNRRFFCGPAESHGKLQFIKDAANKIPGCSLAWLETSEQRIEVLRLIRLAEGERFRNPTLHAEIFENIRFDLGWVRTSEEGLPPGALEIERPLRPIFRLMRHWQIMRLLNFFGAYRQLGWRAGDLPCRFSPHLGVVSSPSLADSDQLNAGRSFQRAWLASTQLELSLQPMPATVLYAHTAAADHCIPTDLQEKLLAGWNRLQMKNIPLMVFRMGHAKSPSIRSTRLSLEHYLHNVDTIY